MLLALAAAATASINIELTPSADSAGEIRTLGIVLRFEDLQVPLAQPLLRLPLVTSNVDTVATTVKEIDARDEKGPLRLTSRDVYVPVEAAGDAEAGGASREWVADRSVSGTLTVRYTIPAYVTLPSRGPAGPYAFINEAGATSVSAQIFLLLPPANVKYRTTVKWDMSAMPKGTQGVSSYGVGDVNATELLTAGRLRMAFYMVGRLGIWTDPSLNFFSAWQGTPPFDAEATLRWTAALYGKYVKFFGAMTSPSYGVLLRYNPINAGGGVGLYHSFLATFGRPGGDGSDAEEFRFMLAHEMFHTFQPYIENPAGLESSWFGEGLATLYMNRLPLRYGAIDSAAFLKEVNMFAGRYYTSIKLNTPNRDVAKLFWQDTRVRTLPYDRGMLYFASVDDAVRKKSAGRRSLDDLMLAMLAMHRTGATLTNSDWEAQLRAELGEEAVGRFHAFLEGEAPVPASDAFGPCFRRTTKPLRRYELGFEPAVLSEPKRIVRGLVLGTAAAEAGLKDGDEIVVPIPQDVIQGDQTRLLRLTIRRGDRTFPLDYLPRGETVMAYQWERVPDVPEARCAL